MKNKVRWVALTGVGTALFVAVTLCLQVPVFENYYLCLGYIVMAVYCYSVDTLSGTLVGCLGTFLYCLLISGMRGMPGWVIGNLVIGVVIGITFKKTKKMKKTWLKAIINFAAIAFSTAIGILVLKSLTECLLYAQPMALRVAKNVYAFVADIFVLEISLPLCMTLDSKLQKLINKPQGQ
ncbi:MAG: ECF transporter S component [Eubacterium sp.]|nr:ECF transporter S component [Eubacterium sp.]